MLDDLKHIHQLDSQDALGIAQKQFQQLQHTFEIGDLSGPYENVVVAGMGGSALAALLSTSWPGYKVPFEICQQYTIPHYVSEKTLFIASSYSGNTEEELEAIRYAEERGAKIVIITSGGRLEHIAREKVYPLALLPPNMQPRHAALSNFKALLDITGQADVTAISSVEVQRELERAAHFLQTVVVWWKPEVATDHNYPKQIALEMAGKSPVIYAGPLMFAAAYKWKISINENAKNIAWCNKLPEFNHNEFLGWVSHPTQKPYAVVDLRSSFEHSRVQKRFEVTNRLLSGKRPHAFNIEAEGDTILQQLLWHVVFGDFMSIYLAILNGVNPTPVDLMEQFKLELNS